MKSNFIFAITNFPKEAGEATGLQLIDVHFFSFQISTWPLSVPGSNGTYLQQPVAFLPDASALAQTPSRRLDKSDKLEVRDDLKNVELIDQFLYLIVPFW